MIEARLMPLPPGLKGFVHESCGEYTIILNSNLTREQNEQTYLHEIEHISQNDLYSPSPADEIEKNRHQP